jgi:hypothetical protein
MGSPRRAVVPITMPVYAGAMRSTERKPGKPGTGSLPNMLEKSSSTMTGKASVKNTAAGSRRNNFAST